MGDRLLNENEETRPLDVLVVDDADADSRVVCRWLSEMRMPRTRPLAASSAAVARTYLASHRFDVVILDRMLGDDDGLSVLRDLRASPLNSSAVVILASGLCEEPGLADDPMIGADAYMTKPFTTDMLRARLRVAVRRRRERAEDGA